MCPSLPRAVLAGLLAVGALAAPQQDPTLSVLLIRPDGERFTDNAVVELIGPERSIRLTRDVVGRRFVGSPRPATYELRVRAGRLESVPREVSLTGSAETLLVHLGKAGWPFYRLGGLPIPFEPRDDLVAVCYTVAPPSRQEVLGRVPALIDGLKLAAFSARRGSDPPHLGADGAVLFLEITDTTPRETIEAELRSREPEARVGLPIDLGEGRVKVLDNRYRVRFADGLSQEAIDATLAGAGAVALRGYLQSPRTRLVEFTTGDYVEHLAAVEGWLAANTIDGGEPDLIAQARDDDFPETGAPDDPAYIEQSNLELQNVPQAWNRLAAVDSDLAFGSPAVRVAFLDRSLELSHDDLGGDLTDGEPQIAGCYDALYERDCSSGDYGPADEDHGMKVFGVVGAHADNGTGTAGIAPNTHQIVVTYPPLGGSSYADALLWVAGFDPEVEGWPDPPYPGADVICCAHGKDGLALSDLMSKTFEYLTTMGRDGRGTVVVYSTGNRNKDIAGYRTWAADPRTVAVGYTMMVGTDEKRSRLSNYGAEVDLCAYGQDVYTLTLGNDVTNAFTGTSAAAPTVAGTVALMLSVSPDLTWSDVRDVLRSTAVKLQVDDASIDELDAWVDLDGDGVPDFSKRYGYGRVDALAAVVGAVTRATTASDTLLTDEETSTVDTGTVTVQADVAFEGEPADAATIDLALLLEDYPGHRLAAGAVWAGVESEAGGDPLPPAGERPDRTLVRDLALSIGADGWDPEPFSLALDPDLTSARLWCRVTCVLHPDEDPSLPSVVVQLVAVWPVPASNTPEVTHTGWTFTEIG